MPSLHPCPYCGAGVEIMETDSGGFCVACGCCGMGGPEGRTPEESAEGWSVLMSRICTNCRKARAVAHKRLMDKYLALKRKQINSEKSNERKQINS